MLTFLNWPKVAPVPSKQWVHGLLIRYLTLFTLILSTIYNWSRNLDVGFAWPGWCHITIFRLVLDYVGSCSPGKERKIGPRSFFWIPMPPARWKSILSLIRPFDVVVASRAYSHLTATSSAMFYRPRPTVDRSTRGFPFWQVIPI